MKSFTRIAALSLAAFFGATAVFAQTSAAPAKTHVKGYTKTLKSGKTVQVKGYNRMAKPATPKMAHVKGYTKMTKTGAMVHVKGYTRKVSPKKGMKPAGTM